MKLGKLFVAIAALTLLIATPVLANCDDGCPPPEPIWWWPPNPQSNITGYNEAHIEAILNAGSLDVWEGSVTINATAAGVIITAPAGCGECPGGLNVSGFNTGHIEAVINAGAANLHGPVVLDATAAGVIISSSKK